MEDIEIARKAKLENITKIATKLGIDEEYICLLYTSDAADD